MTEAEIQTVKIEDIGPQIINMLANLANNTPKYAKCMYTASNFKLVEEIIQSLAILSARKYDVGKELIERLKNEYTNAIRGNEIQGGQNG